MIVPNMNVKKWTEGSIFCYERGCRCEGCFVKDIIKSGRCEMKSAVFTLVKKFGAPKELMDGKYTGAQCDVIKSILKGSTTKKNIAADLDKTEVSIQCILNDLYRIAKASGCNFQQKKYMLPKLAQWLREEEFKNYEVEL